MKSWLRGVLIFAVLLFPLTALGQEQPPSLQEVITALSIPADWGTLKSVISLPGNPPYFSLFFEDAAGTIRIVPVYLSVSGNTWYLLNKRDPVAVIRRMP